MKHSKIMAILVSISLILTLGCTDDNPKKPKDSDSNEPIINILHAGGAYNELTLLNAQEPFEYYYSLGYRYFEYDLKLSSDGKLIATHDFEHLPTYDQAISYEDFKKLKLPYDMTPVNEEWLIETIRNHPDIKIVVDAKMQTRQEDVDVLRRIEELEGIYDIDLSSNIIPEIFSIEMWNEAQLCTTFDNYLFSHYKEYYSIETMIEHFSSDKILGMAIPVWSDSYISSNIYRVKEIGKKLFIFTVKTEEDLNFARTLGADGIYVDSNIDFLFSTQQ